MKQRSLTTVFGVLAGMIISYASVWAAIGTPASKELRFRVLLDGKDIGYHTFTIANQGQTEVVDIKAEFDVRVFFVPVYRYRHDNTEVWRDGCLTRIAARTDDNGTRYDVKGERRDDAFKVVTQDDSRTLTQNCVMTFAYWNRDFLKQSRLLNAQTGEYLEVEVEALEDEAFQLPGGDVPANGFRVLGAEKKLDIKVWYAQDSGRWLALESAVDNGRVLRYLPA